MGGGYVSKVTLKSVLEALKELAVTEYSELDPTNIAAARKEFLEDSNLRVPNFRYEREQQSPDSIRQVLAQLNTIRQQAIRHLNSDERDLVLEISKNQQAQANLLLAASEYREQPNIISAEKFATCNNIRYGKPDYSTVLALLDYELDQINRENFTKDEEKIYQRLLINLPEREHGSRNFFEPQSETITKFGQLFRRYLAPFFRYLPENQKKFTPEEVMAIVNQTIDREIRPWSGTKFHAEISDEKTALSVDQIERIMWIPRHRANGDYTRNVVESTVLGHEMVHLFRGVPYEQCGVPALSYGFPGYDAAEEGITTACTTAIANEKWKPQGANCYVNIGLAYHFRAQGFDFRKIFEVRRDIYYLSSVNPQDSAEQKLACFQKAENRAFSEANRTTRGTGVLPYHKDLIYFNGNQKIWHYIENKLGLGDLNSCNELIHEIFWSGKTDPLEPKHMEIAKDAASGVYGKTSSAPWNKA